MLENLINTLKKEFDADSLFPNRSDIRGVVPTGSIALDNAIGIGGYPVGRVSEIFGAESVGKSTLCIHAAIMTQLMNKGCIYIDAENSFQPKYAERLGLNLESDKFLLIQPDTAEQGLEVVEYAVQDPGVGLVILDSVAAMVPSKESFGQGEMGDNHIGLVARLMTQFNRRITPLMKNKAMCALLLINQVRENIGGGPYASLQTPGGRALKHGMAIRIKLSRKSNIKDSSGLAINVSAQVVKNKVATPYAETEFIIRPGYGIDTNAEITDLLIEKKIIKKAGSWLKDSEGNTIGQGTGAVSEWIMHNFELVSAILRENNVNELYVKRFDETRNQNLSGLN